MTLKKHEIQVPEENVSKLLNKLNEEIQTYERLDDDKSFCNPIYSITSKSGREYILKVINPLDKWKKKKTINEVFTIKLIEQKTNVPVPKIYDYSSECDEIGFEYILMEKIEGNNLTEKFSQDKMNYLKQIANFVEEFQKIKFNKIGSLNEKYEVVEDLDIGAGPFNYFKEWAQATIQRRLIDLEKTKFKHYAPRFNEYSKLIDDVSLPIVFCHSDLELKNFIERNGKIVGLIDFEWAGAYPYIQDISSFEYDYKLNKEELEEFQKILDEKNITYKMPNEVKDTKRIKSLAMVLCSYEDWFVGKEKEAEEFIKGQEEYLIKLFEKYNLKK